MPDIYEQVRKADFNKTEPETLSQLVDGAIRVGDEIKGDYVRRRQLTDEIYSLLKRESLLRTVAFKREDLLKFSTKTAAGSDGSFQSVGGVDGLWYVPVSAALITFNGISATPTVTVGARIIKIDEREFQNVGAAMETSMLTAEANVLKEWGRSCPEEIIHFLDGPTMDPPRQMDKEYVNYRVSAISSILDKRGFVLCCVKKLLGNFLIEYIGEILRDTEAERVRNFSADAYLIYHVFTKVSLQANETIYTVPQEIPNVIPMYKPYKDAGLAIYFMYFQRETASRPFRVDIPVKSGSTIDSESLGREAAEALAAWSYPGHDLPLPIVMAHDKCNIRKGCAEVLYSEIITRSASDNPFDNLVKARLSGEVF